MTNPGPWKKAVPCTALLQGPGLFGLFRCPVEVHSFEWVETRTPPDAAGDDGFENPQNNEADDDRR